MFWLVATLGLMGTAGWVLVSYGLQVTVVKRSSLRYRGRHYAARIYAAGDVPRFTAQLLRHHALPAARLTIRQQIFLVRTSLSPVMR